MKTNKINIKLSLTANPRVIKKEKNINFSSFKDGKYYLSYEKWLRTRASRRKDELTKTDEATNEECAGTGDSWSSNEENTIIDHCDIECGTTDTPNNCVVA